ncbi:MAG: hypothetical protein FJ100_12375 [Deltaproteobacteria bacterium]|nr:hypothetical protein [Deltaproteobacteria bacterium]
MNNAFKLAAAAAALGLVAAPAFATDSRINALSGGAVELTPSMGFNEKSITIDDTANIYQMPQFLPTYKNSVDSDATNGPLYGTMNIRYALSDDAVLLIFGKRSPWQPVVNVKSIGGKTPYTASGFGQTSVDPTNHLLGLGFGIKAGESLRLGAHLSLAGNKAEGDGSSQDNNMLIDFGAGIGFDLNETNSLDFGIGLRTGSFAKTAESKIVYESQGLFGFDLVGRGKFQVHQIARIVPYLSVKYDGRAVQEGQPFVPQGKTPKFGRTVNLAFSAGTDLAIQPVDGVLIQPGLGFGVVQSNVNGNNDNVSNWDQEISARQFLHYGFAAEAKAFDWMVLRLGARQTVLQDNFGPTNKSHGGRSTLMEVEKHTSDVINTVTTGMGFKLMGWQLDLNLNPNYYNNGLFAATGNATSGWGVDWALYYAW